MEGESELKREKRFKVCTFIPLEYSFTNCTQHRSYQATLKDVHLPSALTRSKFDNDIEVKTQPISLKYV
jgi:hypothetical protein